MKRILFVLAFIALAVGGFYAMSSAFKGAKEGAKKGWEENCYTCDKDEDSSKELQTEAAEVDDSKAESDAVMVKNETVESDAASDYSPAMWKIEHNGKTSYLFGSIHVGDKSMYPLPQKVMDAFAASEALAVEADITKVDQMQMAQTVQQLALDLENPLPTVLSEKTKAKYDVFCETQTATCNMVKVFEPWMAALTIEVMGVMKAGYSEELGVDKFFIRGAENKEIVELESVDGQLKMLDQMPKELQDFMVLGAISKDADDVENLMIAWKTGQLDEFMQQAEQDAKDLGVSEEIANQFNEIFLYKRNQVMADGIADLINSGKSVFAVVGAAHYAGENSVNQYLEAKGFKIERI
ncbi:MAG: TraB/GumN family protein [Gammaproteobacteria bacterium]|nr:TraB/GumN family protein [Gammaproteobacteria bacterium]